MYTKLTGTEKQVLGLEISVHDTLIMHVAHGLEHDLEEIPRLLLGIVLFRDNTVKELATLGQLRHDEEFAVLVESLVESMAMAVIGIRSINKLRVGDKRERAKGCKRRHRTTLLRTHFMI